MLAAMRAYRDGGFNGPFAFDHHPKLDHPASPEIGRAFATGYLRGLIKAVYGRRTAG